MTPLCVGSKDDDTGHAASLRHVFQELFEGLNPPAEAPMPTMGKTSSLCRGGISSFAPAAGLLSLPPRLDGFVTGSPPLHRARIGSVGAADFTYAFVLRASYSFLCPA